MDPNHSGKINYIVTCLLSLKALLQTWIKHGFKKKASMCISAGCGEINVELHFYLLFPRRSALQQSLCRALTNPKLLCKHWVLLEMHKTQLQWNLSGRELLHCRQTVCNLHLAFYHPRPAVHHREHRHRLLAHTDTRTNQKKKHFSFMGSLMIMNSYNLTQANNREQNPHLLPNFRWRHYWIHFSHFVQAEYDVQEQINIPKKHINTTYAQCKQMQSLPVKYLQLCKRCN